MSNEFETALAWWLNGAIGIVTEGQEDKDFSYALVTVPGRKYVKIVRKDVWHGELKEDTGSAFAFIDKTTGQVFKPASWKSPAKGARGNIYSEDRGLNCVGKYGIAYLRG